MYDFYIAAPLFTDAERSYNESIFYKLRSFGFKSFLPQSHFRADQAELFKQNVNALIHSKGLIAICDGADIDSGTAWEVGHFYGRGEIYALRTDIRKFGDDSNFPGFNLMISRSADHFFKDSQFMTEWLSTNR